LDTRTVREPEELQLVIDNNWSVIHLPPSSRGFPNTDRFHTSRLTQRSDASVSAALDWVLGDGPASRSITIDHETEFQSRILEDWAYRRGVQLNFIRLGSPWEMLWLNRYMDVCEMSV
jgi:hypothetical protein